MLDVILGVPFFVSVIGPFMYECDCVDGDVHLNRLLDLSYQARLSIARRFVEKSQHPARLPASFCQAEGVWPAT